MLAYHDYYAVDKEFKPSINLATYMTNILDVGFSDMDGNEMTLRKLSGNATKHWVVVNVASKCGLTKQYEDLQTYSLQEDVVIVGFPCNQFGGQEPGSHEEICDFTSNQYSVTFPLMAKINVKGEKQCELYQLLTKVSGVDGHIGEIRWNFEKFKIDSQGKISRYSPQTRISEVL